MAADVFRGLAIILKGKDFGLYGVQDGVGDGKV